MNKSTEFVQQSHKNIANYKRVTKVKACGR